MCVVKDRQGEPRKTGEETTEKEAKGRGDRSGEGSDRPTDNRGKRDV